MLIVIVFGTGCFVAVPVWALQIARPDLAERLQRWLGA